MGGEWRSTACCAAVLIFGAAGVASQETGWQVVERFDDFGDPRDPEILGPLVHDETGFGLQARVQADCDRWEMLPADGMLRLDLGFDFSVEFDARIDRLFGVASYLALGVGFPIRSQVAGDRYRFLASRSRPDSGVGGDVVRIAPGYVAVVNGFANPLADDFKLPPFIAHSRQVRRSAGQLQEWQQAALAADEIVVVFGQLGAPVRFRFDMRGAREVAERLPCVG